MGDDGRAAGTGAERIEGGSAGVGSVEAIRDREEIQAFLERDRIRGAYMLGDLDPVYFDFCRWYGARVDGRLEALLLHYSGLSVPAVLTTGSAAHMEALVAFASRFLPRRFYLHVVEEHLPAMRKVYLGRGLKRMVRMALHKDAYRPAAITSGADTSGAGSSGVVPGVVPVGHPDTGELMALYQYYPDAFFEPYQLESGLYFGVRDGLGRLVSVAGVHVISDAYDVAIIGNVVTHPDHRGRGHSTRCTGHLLDRLFERVGLVALNVEEGNDAARHTYRKFGFKDECVYLEGFTEHR